MKAKIERLAREYGPIALATYFTIFFAVLGGFWVAITAGFEVSSSGGNLGAVAAAWLATKVTQPLRIVATVALTPLVARVVRKKASEDVAPVPEESA